MRFGNCRRFPEVLLHRLQSRRFAPLRFPLRWEREKSYSSDFCLRFFLRVFPKADDENRVPAGQRHKPSSSGRKERCKHKRHSLQALRFSCKSPFRPAPKKELWLKVRLFESVFSNKILRLRKRCKKLFFAKRIATTVADEILILSHFYVALCHYSTKTEHDAT